MPLQTDPLPLSPVLDPGSLFHVGTIVGQGVVDLPNGGQEVSDVILVADEPMSIDPLSGRERTESGGILSEATHRIRLYWVAGVRPTQQVRMHDDNENRDRVFEILSVMNEQERGFVLDLVVVEKVS